MRTITFALLAALAASPSLLRAQQPPEKKAPAAPSLHALVEATKIRLDQAIALALDARAGVAVGVELEGKAADDKNGDKKVVPLFEVMVSGKDGNVYEVFVNGVDGAIVSKDACKDEEDKAEVKAIAGSGDAHMSLQDVVAEAKELLRGTCVEASLTGKDAQAHVVLLNRGRRVGAQWSLKDGNLLGVAWLDAKKGKKADDDDDDDDDEEGEEHEGGEHANGKKKGEEEEEHEGGKHREREKGGKGNREEPKHR